MFDEIEGPAQKRWVKLLIIVAIAIPILVEVITFAGLVSHSLGAGGGDGAEATTTVGTEGAGPGDEVLEDAPVTARITDAAVTAREDGWQFVLSLDVNNTDDSPHEVRFGNATTTAGRTVSTTATTGKLSPGERGTVTASWILPQGERPDSVTATVVTDPSSDAPTSRVYEIDLAGVPVSSG